MQQLNKETAYGVWNISGNFGELWGNTEIDGNKISYKSDELLAESITEEYENGVFVRKDTVKNICDKPLAINFARAVFNYDNSDFEVYTQYNMWLHESTGAWTHLNTTVSSASESVRNTNEANPIIALWDKQVNRGMVFHLVPESAWNMSVIRKHAELENQYVEVQIGIDSRNFAYTLNPGEELKFPEIIYYEIKSKTDLDCWKLHNYWIEKYPQKELPVIFNTWLATYDFFDADNIKELIVKAKELGCEYFVTDAGWFGSGNKRWAHAVGDWTENQTAGFCGRMEEVADFVRENGMKFGLWFEPERALNTADAYNAHPEYYIKSIVPYFGEFNYLNFADEKAFNYIYDAVSYQIRRCKIEFVKFDFNADMIRCDSQDAYISYFKGQRKFIERLKAEFPGLYIENCASGGERMHLGNCKMYESFWFTDNQNIYDSMEIIKNTTLRMPPQFLERWTTIGTAKAATPKQDDLLYSIGDAAFKHIVGVNENYIHAFLSGGPLGISFDLRKIEQPVFDRLKEHIEAFKKNRSFWQNARCRVLSDTESLFVLEYHDKSYTKAVIQVFAKHHTQAGIRVYPVLSENKTYIQEDGAEISGAKLMNDGVYIKINSLYDAPVVTLEEKE